MNNNVNSFQSAELHYSNDRIPQNEQFGSFSNFHMTSYEYLYLIIVPLVVVVRWKLLSYTRVQWHHAKSTVKLKSKHRGQVQLSQLCKSITPSCFLHPLLRSRHLQTLYPLFKKGNIPLYFRRTTFESQNSEYRGSFAVDLTVAPSSAQDPDLPPHTAYYSDEAAQHLGSQDSRPMLVTLHGLCGGSHESYLQRVLAPLVKGDQKWEACVVLSRGCGQSSITGGGMYYAHATSDLRQVVKWLRQHFPNRPLYAVGFSMGANILTRYIADEGKNCEFKAAVVVSNPWNLETTALHLQHTRMGRWLYSPAMAANLMQVFHKNTEHLENVAGKPLDMEPPKKVHMLHEYDRYIQCQTWGFPTERVYYRKASSSDSVLKVNIPFLAINADDDPIIGYESLPRGEFQASPYTVLCTTNNGGHLGWVTANGGRWYADTVISFLQEMHVVQWEDTGKL